MEMGTSLSINWAKEEFRRIIQRGRGRRFSSVIGEVNQFTRGWVGYYRPTRTKNIFELYYRYTRVWTVHRFNWQNHVHDFVSPFRPPFPKQGRGKRLSV